MGIRFVLMVNKQGQTRLAQYYEYLTIDERLALEGEIVRKCLARNEQQNELAILDFIHLLVETMDRHFVNVCELDIMFHLEKAHFMLEEIFMNGCLVETSKANILGPVQLMSKNSHVTLIVLAYVTPRHAVSKLQRLEQLNHNQCRYFSI